MVGLGVGGVGLGSRGSSSSLLGLLAEGYGVGGGGRVGAGRVGHHGGGGGGSQGEGERNFMMVVGGFWCCKLFVLSVCVDVKMCWKRMARRKRGDELGDGDGGYIPFAAVINVRLNI